MKVQLFSRLCKQTKAKIDNFNVIILIDHNIVQFDVTVRNLFAMKVLDAHDNPSKDFFSLLFGDALFWFGLKVLIERHFTDILHNKYNLLPGVDCCVELYDVLVVQLSQKLDFTKNILPPLLAIQAIFVIDLKSDLLFSDHVPC